jgi:23S rRNA (adenine2503-C2)-methyltransferase
MNKIRIKDLTRAELEEALKRFGAEAYRADQIFRWLYISPVGSFAEMKDIPASIRDNLDRKFYLSSLEAADLKKSLSDGTTKYLFKLEDGNTIETVLLPEMERNTICLSSQVGCKFACSFCASAPFGFSRNLSQSEMTDEVIAIKKMNPGINITNLVFMGIGEPFDNYDNVLRAIRIFNDRNAFNIGARKITISTCGVVPGMERLAKEGLQIELSVSLHSANDAVRSKLLPVNKKYGLKCLMAACKDYIKSTNRIITFEYVLIKGVNCSEKDALELARLLRGVNCKVNVISYNRVQGKPYEAPSPGDTRIFMRTLGDRRVNATHRKPKGDDIDAGCGQLRISRMK